VTLGAELALSAEVPTGPGARRGLPISRARGCPKGRTTSGESVELAPTRRRASVVVRGGADTLRFARIGTVSASLLPCHGCRELDGFRSRAGERSQLVRRRRAGMDRRPFRLHQYAGATPVVVWRSLAGRFIGRSDPDASHQRGRSFDARVSGVGWVRFANHPASSGRRGSCAGPAPSISAAIRGGRSRSAPVPPDPAQPTVPKPISLPSRSRSGARLVHAHGDRSGRDPAQAPGAGGSSSARAAAWPGRPPAPGAAACRG
jgi:hypothetical protein